MEIISFITESFVFNHVSRFKSKQMWHVSAWNCFFTKPTRQNLDVNGTSCHL